jgi:acetoacetate decarboxylase
LPEPLQPAPGNLTYDEWMKMPDSSCFGDYEESGTDVQALWQGEPCNFSVQMYLDDEPPITGGREIWGFPKKYARALAAEGVNVLINGFGKPARRNARRSKASSTSRPSIRPPT